MSKKEEIIEINCIFCGDRNSFSNDELYERDVKGNQIYREKFCVTCGENLTLICPVCHRGYRLDVNFKENNPLKILPSFWDPHVTLMDEYIPKLEKEFTKYHQIGTKLTPESLRMSQKDFLVLIPQLKIQLENVLKLLEESKKSSEIKNQLESGFKDIGKNLLKNIDECNDITQNIDPGVKLLFEKKESKLKKHVPFLDETDKDKKFLDTIKQIRQNQIKVEKDSLKPGADKLLNYIQQDTQFYRAKCPICNTQTFNINKQMYIIDSDIHQLKFIRTLEQIPKIASNESSSMMIRLKMTIAIKKIDMITLHGQLNFALLEGNSETVGRTLIREADFQEPQANSILYDEDDPLQYVSNTQFVLERKKNQISLKGKEFDPDRPGIYLNDMENDVRKQYPESVLLKSGDKLIIPLNTEEGNPNKIEFDVEIK